MRPTSASRVRALRSTLVLSALVALVLGTFASPSAAATSWGFTSSASGSGTVQVRSNFTAPSSLSSGEYVLDTEIYDSRGWKMAQWHQQVWASPNQQFGYTYNFSTAGLPAGAYTIHQGAFNKAWAMLAWGTATSTFHVGTAPATTTTVGTAGSWSLSGSTSGTGTVQVKPVFTAPSTAGSKQYVLNTEVQNSTGRKVGQWNQTVTAAAGQRFSYTHNFATAGLPAGKYTVRQMVFTSNWGTRIVNQATTSFSVAGSTTTTAPPATPSGPSGPGGSWNLAFSDEFNDSSIDTTKWINCYPWAVGGCTNPGNNELQWYSPNNISESNGSLHMTARKQTVNGNGKTFNYTSGMVTTGPDMSVGKPSRYEFTYGYVEARVKVPKGKGLWPAIWLLPNDGSWPPEIDIMEILGDDTTKTHMTYHYSEGGVHKQSGATYSGPDFSEGYHTFGVDWQPGHITWYVDGVARRTSFTNSAVIPNKPMYVLFNLAVGGNWPGSPDANTPFPSTYSVDWVKVWKKA